MPFQLSSGSSSTIRVALADLRWPLDPALAATRDETTLARAVFATPLRTDDAGRVVPGLCTGWDASADFTTWRFRGCRAAAAIAGELRRVGRLGASPAHWMFTRVVRISVPAATTLVVRLRAPWRRFPYALTSVAAAPRGVPGPFRVVRANAASVMVRDGAKTVVFRRLAGLAALRAYRHGAVDEAPVPLGDVGRFRSARTELRVRRLLAQDVLRFRSNDVPRDIRAAFWQTADRDDYEALVAENGAPAAYGLVAAAASFDPAAFRRALAAIPALPSRPVVIAAGDDPSLRAGAAILSARWRELGLGARLGGGRGPDAELLRVVAAYPQDEALLGALGLPAALGSVDQSAAFARLDGQLRAGATIVPVCWVADARLVSPALHGWHEDVLGDVDYTRVTLG